MIRGERMGHSMGNFVTIAETLNRHDAEALRLYYRMRHYRSQLDFDEADIRQAEEVLDKLRSVYNQFRTLRDSNKLSNDESIDPNIERFASDAIAQFDSAMDDDFNTPRALAQLIAYSKTAEGFMGTGISHGSVERIINTFDYFGNVFGILRSNSGRHNTVVENLLSLLVEMREDARKQGDWDTADRIRNKLTQAGVGLEDTPTGPRWYIASGAHKKST